MKPNDTRLYLCLEVQYIKTDSALKSSTYTHTCSCLCSGVRGAGVGSIAAHLWNDAKQRCRP